MTDEVWFSQEARKSRTFVWWNVWVLLAIPAIWLAWSMIAFVISILSFVWRTGADSDPQDGNRPALTSGEALAVRVVVTFILCLGLLHFVMIIQTFRSYSGRSHHRRRRRDMSGGETDRPGDRPRERQESARNEERGREKGGRPESAAGLGLTGLTGISGSLNTFGSVSAVLIEDADPEKKASGSIRNDDGVRISAEALGPGSSRPKISPKL